MRIEEIYQTLDELGLVRSQMEFSRLWLGKSARYYSSMLARQHQPSVGTLAGLLFRLRNILTHTSEVETRTAIFLLIERLESHVALRSITSSKTCSGHQGRLEAAVSRTASGKFRP